MIFARIDPDVRGEDAMRRMTPFSAMMTCIALLAATARAYLPAGAFAFTTSIELAPPSVEMFPPVRNVTERTPPKTASSVLSLEDFQVEGETTFDAAWMRAVAALPTAGGVIALNAGTMYEFSDAIVLDRGGIMLRCTGYQTCVINFAHAKDGLAVNVKPAASAILRTQAGSQIATLARIDGIKLGMQVKSANVPAATKIVDISGTTARLSANATGDGDLAATFGHFIYNISVDDIVFTRSVKASSGCDINIANAARIEMKNLRIFGKGNSWRGVCLRSVAKAYINEATIENTQDSNVSIEGGTGQYSSLEGGSINIEIEHGDFFGAHAATPNPLHNRRGAIQLGENVSGVFLRSNRFQTFRGYAISLDGVSRPHSAVNDLVFVLDANVEASYEGAGGISIHNYANISITHGWFGGKSAPALRISGESSGVLVTGAALYMDGTSTNFAMECAASSVTLTGVDLSAYRPNLRAIGLEQGCDRLNIAGGFIRQFDGGVWNNGATKPQISINGVQFSSVAREIDPVVEAFGNLVACGNSSASGPMPCYTGTQVFRQTRLRTAAVPEGDACAAAGLRSFANNLAGEHFIFGTLAVGGGRRVGPIWCDGRSWREG